MNKFFKKATGALAVMACAVVFMMPGSVKAATVGVSGSTLTVTGKGAVTASDVKKYVSLKDNITSIVIGDGITKIDDKTFKDWDNVSSVKLPTTLTYVGYHSFDNCSALTAITFPKKLTKTGGSSFANSGVQVATFADGATVIPSSILKDCTALKKVNIPSSVTSVGDSAFDGCTSLDNVVLPWYVTKVNYHAFKNCTGMKNITIYQKAAVDKTSFKGCVNLTVNGKKGSKAETAAKDAGLKFKALSKVPALKGITYTSGKLKYKVISDDITGKGTVVVTAVDRKATSVTIPESVKLESYSYKVVEIGKSAFKGKTKNITIKATGIKAIGKKAFKSIDGKAVITLPKKQFDAYKKLIKAAGAPTKVTYKKK